jgi:hypothetical protein
MSEMNRVLLVLLAVLLILSVFATSCGEPCVLQLAPIRDIDMWADNSSPPQYFLYFVAVQPDGCAEFDSYNMTHAGNTTIILEVFNLDCDRPCPAIESEVELTIPLGSDFVPGVNYTIKVNDVTETFVAQ